MSSDESQSDAEDRRGAEVVQVLRNIAEYNPPENFIDASTSTRSQNFDAGSVEGDAHGKQIWLFRVPEKLPLSALNNVKINLPRSSAKSITSVSLDTPNTSGASVPSRYSLRELTATANPTTENPGLAEMGELEPLLPSASNKGKLVQTKVGVSRYFVVGEDVKLPDSVDPGRKIKERQYVKLSHPDGLKMRFKPFGFNNCPDSGEDQDANPAPTILDLPEVNGSGSKAVDKAASSATKSKSSPAKSAPSSSLKKRKSSISQEPKHGEKKKKKKKDVESTR